MSCKKRIERNPFVPDSNGKFKGRYTDDDGSVFRFTLNLRTTGHYLATGTQSMIDPSSSKPFKIYDATAKTQELASSPIHIKKPADDEDIELLIDIELNRVRYEIKQRFQSQFNASRKTGKLLYEMTFKEAVLAFLDDAKTDHSASESVRSGYASSIRTFEKALPDLKIGDIKQKTIKDAVSSASDRGLKKLKDLTEFIKFAEKQQMTDSGVIPVVEKAIQSLPKTGNEQKHRNASKRASNSDSLSDAAEEVFNQRISAYKFDAAHVALALIKGTGLSVSEICKIKIGQIERDNQARDVLFIRINKSYASATQDYTFPIFPFEAMLLNDYMDELGKNTPCEDRLASARYLFSSDCNGTTQLSENAVKHLCRAELQQLQFGYADLLGRTDLQKEKGIELLKRTYLVRLNNCGLGVANEDGDIDEGAFLFMLHRSLGNKMQADHYRGFTGESGREFLLSVVLQDRRFIITEHERIRKEVTYRTHEGYREYTLRKKDNKNIQQATIVVKLNAGEIARIEAEHGCTAVVEKVVPQPTFEDITD